MDVLIAYRILFLATAAVVVFLAVRDTRRLREQRAAMPVSAFEPASEPVDPTPVVFRPGGYFRRMDGTMNPTLAERIRVLQDLLREGAISQQEHDTIVGRVHKQA